MPLSNVNSVMGEVNSGKMTRRLHFQDELPAGTMESPIETGHALAHNLKLLFVVLRLIQCWYFSFTLNRWCKGQPFKQLQEAAIHLNAHRLRR